MYELVRLRSDPLLSAEIPMNRKIIDALLIAVLACTGAAASGHDR